MDFFNNSKWFSAVPLLALIMLLTGWNLRQSPQTKKNIYRNDSLRFEFKYAGAWMSGVPKGNVLAEYKILDKPDVQMQVKKIEKYMLNYKTSHEHFDKVTFKNFTKIDGTDLKTGNMDAYKLSFSYTATDEKNNETKMYATQVLIPMKEYILLFSLSANEENYPAYEEAFFKTFESVTFM